MYPKQYLHADLLPAFSRSRDLRGFKETQSMGTEAHFSQRKSIGVRSSGERRTSGDEHELPGPAGPRGRNELQMDSLPPPPPPHQHLQLIAVEVYRTASFFHSEADPLLFTLEKQRADEEQ